MLKPIVSTDFVPEYIPHPYVSKNPVLSTVVNPFVKTADPVVVPSSFVPPVQPVQRVAPIGMSLQTMNDLFGTADYGNSGIGGYYLNPLKVDDSKIGKVIGTAQNLANSPVVGASQNGIAAGASIVNGQPLVETQTQGNGIFSSVLGVLGNVLGQILSGPAGGVASQGGSSTSPIGGGAVISNPANNPSPATQPGQPAPMNLAGILVPLAIGFGLLKIFKII